MVRTLGVLALALAAGGAESAPGPRATVEDLAWLAGCWEGTGQGRVVAEQWMKPLGGTLLGMSRTVSGDETVSHEHLLIREDDHGLHYVARPSGQSETSFKLVRLAEHEAVFENPEHDFPQRVLYRLAAGGELTAAIEGAVDGRARRIEFPMKRVSCD
jgi:hypothetical protein